MVKIRLILSSGLHFDAKDLLGSSHRYKRLTWRSQGQLLLSRRFCSKLQKKIHNTHTDTWRILRYKSIIDKVSLKLHKASSKTIVLILWTSFTLQVMKMLTLLANSHRHNSTAISRVPNQYLKWLFSYSNHPSTFKTYWLLLIRSQSSWRQKLVPTPLAVCTMQGRLWIYHKVHSK